MKRTILHIGFYALLMVAATSCFDNVPKVEDLPQDAVSFTYRIEGDYALDYYVGSEITFTNTSPTQGTAVWDFGDGKSETGNSVKHFFDEAGTYYVRLSIGELSRKQVIMISDIKPLMTINPIEGGLCEVNSTKVNFSLEVPNPQNLSLEYNWIFPEGTKRDGLLVENCTDTLPGDLTFSNVGSQTVRLQVKLGGRMLEEGRVNVQVGYNQPVPTLYYAVQGGNIMALKLIDDAPEDMKVSPFDLALTSGQHPFNLLFKDSLLFVLDCGKQFYYVDDQDGVLGDGKISVIAKDGSKLETMITNVGQAAFDDPFYGAIVGDKLYYANRNTGIIPVPLNTRNAIYSKTDFPYFVEHNTLGYYNNGWGYGCIGGCFDKIDGVWHWAKFYNGEGLYRFEDADILPTATAQGTPEQLPKAGRALGTMRVKSFVFDHKTNRYTFSIWDDGSAGVYSCTKEELEAIGTSKTKLAPYKKLHTSGLGFEPNISGSPAAVEGTSSEPVAICQMALDEKSGYVYFAFRNNHNDPTSAPSGLYRYNPDLDKIETVIEGPSIYGLVINQEPSKLF
ncbi:MAG: PKD domain-containing protein [Paludibacteraceae bacterium]|nr:PKD domain-containing protein [Paludibacteraceae bacterium]